MLSSLFSREILREFCSKSFAFISVIFLIKIGEHIALNIYHDIHVMRYHQHIFNSFIRELLYAFHASAVLLPFYLLIGRYRSVKTANKFFMITGVILLIIHLFLLKYFFSSMMLLDRIIVTVPWDQMSFVFQSELDWTDSGLYIFFGISLALIIGYLFLSRVNFTNKPSFYAYWILFIASFALIPINNLPKEFFRESISHNFTNNKEIFLIRDIINRYKHREDLNNTDDLDYWIAKYQQQNEQFDFLYKAYPLLHKNNYNDVLGPYFDLKETPPNFVFIMAESISRTFSGPNSEHGSFTPFLDSLAKQSLYFENFLSNADKTYGIYTNLYASLPNANERGVINMGDQIPNHHAIFTILKDNKYQSNVFFTGWRGFDRMNEYFDLLQFNHYFSYDDYPEAQDPHTKTTWGTHDHFLYKRSFDLMEQNEITPPYANLYIPISLHSPFGVPESYEPLISQKYSTLKKQYNTSEARATVYSRYEEELSTCLYADQALKEFLEDYKKHPDYDNTIFVIAGDHNIGVIPTKNPLRLYHVPLIIYSPLLKKSGSFKALNTQRDVVPSFLALLDNKYPSFEQPEIVHWIGTGLDLGKNFTSKKKDSFSIFSGEKGLLVGTNYYDKDFGLFEVHDNIELTKLDSTQLLEAMKDRFETWEYVSNYVINKNWILPQQD